MRGTRWLQGAALASLWLAAPAPSVGEVVYEGGRRPVQLGSEQIIDTTDPEALIRGQNVFYFFDQFNVSRNRGVRYRDSASVAPTAVFNAILDNEPSSFNGSIVSEYNANFYFLNPNGILFGPDATIDIGGSLFLTSADVVEFANGESFEVRSGGAVPSMGSSPVAFGFLPGAAGDIGIDGDVAFVGVEEFGMFGGDVGVGNFADVKLPGGVIRVAAVGSSAAEVPIALADWDVSGLDPDALGEFRLFNNSSLDANELAFPVGPPDQGRVVIRGGRVVIDTASIFAAGDGTPGSLAIDIQAAGRVEDSGGGVIASFGLGTPAVGSIRIDAEEVDLDFVQVRLRAFDGPVVGDLEITADRLTLTNGAVIESTTEARFGVAADGGG